MPCDRPALRIWLASGVLVLLSVFLALPGSAATGSDARAFDGVPAKPTRLGVGVQPGALEVEVSWDDVPGATSYSLSWRQQQHRRPYHQRSLHRSPPRRRSRQGGSRAACAAGVAQPVGGGVGVALEAPPLSRSGEASPRARQRCQARYELGAPPGEEPDGEYGEAAQGGAPIGKVRRPGPRLPPRRPLYLRAAGRSALS